ncbi:MULTISPECIES: Uma2 family endonuclease [Spirulina sp. CCY15215]|uniref:Uma2 family endonuclease n=1 Tax=Spirulina sp. CCY15215 TaxID=2767591 RepID=UPI0019517946|nr:Uma2 family endonuclease [Spirulina major]
MYDLPSEEVGEPGLPDQFHPLQAELLRLTFQPRTYPSERVFSAMDLNIYYDENNTRRYKRPDWFGVVGVSQLYEEQDLRLSYVIWQEGVNPFIVVELLSPSTQAQDLGQVASDPDGKPTKWEVYEEILQIPYYVVYDREQNYFRVFHLESGRYQELELNDNRLWLAELGLGLGLWQGINENVDRLWLRFYDASLNWILTPTEQERQRADFEQQRANLEQQRANFEQQRADFEQQRADLEQQEKELAQQRIEHLERLLRENNINPDANL